MGIRHFRTIQGKARSVNDQEIQYDGNKYRFVEFSFSGHMSPKMYDRVAQVIDEVEAEMKVVMEKSEEEEVDHILKTGEWRD